MNPGPSDAARPSWLEIEGAHDHNLQGVDLAIEHGRWTSVVGPSGSGKTTLVFDTIVREGERRYLGALSPKARQFFGKLGRADVTAVRGLPAPMAVGRRSVTNNPRSTVGTQSGVVDLLRLLFARLARHADEPELTRSHFSFNVPAGACPTCTGLGIGDHVDPDLLIADASKSIRGGALVPTLKSGYTVYSQVTLPVMDDICRAHGFDVDTPWEQLSEEQQRVVLYGTKRLKVPFGKHELESRMKWQGITARPREEGYYRGLVPVIEETLKRNRNANILRFVRSVPCSECAGTRLGTVGREARIGAGPTFPDLVARASEGLRQGLDEIAAAPDSDARSTTAAGAVVGAVLGALRPAIDARLSRMDRLGLGHLGLARASTSLSAGEAQRLRLVAHLVNGLSEALYALDEPTLGLHPESQAGMRDVLDDLVAEGNTLVVVEHDPDMVAFADRVIAMGPGAGPDGGRVVDEIGGPARALGPPPRPKPTRDARAGAGGRIELGDASLHNLRSACLAIDECTLHVVAGPSGAGKTSLVFGTLLPALVGAPGGPFVSLRDDFTGASRAVDARPMGRSSRSTPATWSGVFESIRRTFAATDAARRQGWAAGHFSFNTKGGRCETCEGLGTTRVGLHLLEDAVTPCASCGGARYDEPTLAVRVKGASIAEVLAMSVADAAAFFDDSEAIAPTLRAMVQLGVGYLRLGAPSAHLSSGEAQRIRLATLLARPASEPTLYVFDEPDRGLHPGDLERLLSAFAALVAAGHTVLAITHHRHLWAAADAITEVRDGVARRVDFADIVLPPPSPRAPRRADAGPIRIRGARTHNLRGLDLDIARHRVTAIVGPSGSGKTSLAYGTVAAEAWHRFSESLPFQVRRFVHRAPRPDVDSMDGLTPVVALRQAVFGPGRGEGAQSTLATESEVGPLLRLLFARAGTLDGQPARLTAGHFSPASALGACPSCGGRGSLARCDVSRLAIDGTKSIAEGAFAATKPGAFFTEPDGQHLATLKAAAGHDLEMCWDELPAEVRRIALGGTGETSYSVTWRFRRGGREGEHAFEGPWEGLTTLIEHEAKRRGAQRARSATKAGAAWQEVLHDVTCPACEGARLRPEVNAVTVGGHSLAAVLALPLDGLLDALASATDEPAWAGIGPELARRCGDLLDLGLGALSLDRPTSTLSRGELQRVRLASVLRSGLCGTTVVLDEPTVGLAVAEAQHVAAKLRELCALGNTVLVVTHRPEVIEVAHEVVELGPGAGVEGGTLVAHCAVEVWRRSGSASATSLDQQLAPVPGGERRLSFDGRSLPDQGFVALTGASGTGASRLLHGQVREALGPHFTSVVDSRDHGGGALVLTALGGMPELQREFHAAASGAGIDLPRAAFSFMSPKGRCPACGGTGSESVAMDFMADLELSCATCDGSRYRPEVLDVRWNGRTVAEFLDATVNELAHVGPRLERLVTTLGGVGLGHLALGRTVRSLSGGERQRLALASGQLSAKGRTLFLLEEPEAGLSEPDVAALAEVFRRLAAEGHLVVATVHRRSLIGAASMTLELPGAEEGLADQPAW